tara:strand:+ start:750 stop:983 length:234 start_codon:yes stop_codon:yes gene_type:complete
MWEKVLKYETEFDSLEEYESQDPRRLFEDLIQMTDDGDELASMLLSEIERMLPIEKVRKILDNIKANLNNPDRKSNF